MAPTTYLNFIDGEWRATRSGRTFENINPADTRDVVGLLQDSDAADVDAAVQAGQKAFPAWASMPAPARGKILLKAAAILEGRIAEMGDLLAREEGKTIGEAKGEVTRAVRILEYFGGEGARLSGQTIPSERPRVFMYTIKQPLGVVALIAPWNFPIAIPTWKMAPALVSGNSVVFKPASQAPLTSLELVKILEQAGIPKGVLNLVTGSGSNVGTPLVAHPLVRAISFTGSDGVGKGIAKVGAERLARVQLEMGGKNPTIVLADADMDVAVDCVLNAAFFSTGQRCTATSRAIVEKGAVQPFVERLVARAEKLKIGDPRDPSTELGPAIDEKQLKTTLRYLDIGKQEGATLVHGGERLSDGAARARLVQPSGDHDRRSVAVEAGSGRSVRSAPRHHRGQGLQRRRRPRQRRALRPVGVDLHDQHQPRPRLRRARRGRHGDGQPAVGGRRVPHSVRRHEGLEQRLARTGPRRHAVLHREQDRLHEVLTVRRRPPGRRRGGQEQLGPDKGPAWSQSASGRTRARCRLRIRSRRRLRNQSGVKAR